MVDLVAPRRRGRTGIVAGCHIPWEVLVEPKWREILCSCVSGCVIYMRRSGGEVKGRGAHRGWLPPAVEIRARVVLGWVGMVLLAGPVRLVVRLVPLVL